MGNNSLTLFIISLPIKEISYICIVLLIIVHAAKSKWDLWFLEVFEEISVLETLQYPKWRFASPICNTKEIEVVSLRYIDSTRKRRCLYFMTLTARKKGDVSILWLISFGEIRGASKMIRVIPWSSWGNQSIGNFAVSKMAICLTNLQHCRNRGCLFALYWLHAKKEMSLF